MGKKRPQSQEDADYWLEQARKLLHTIDTRFQKPKPKKLKAKR